jgi:feruloyl-CoA synthase
LVRRTLDVLVDAYNSRQSGSSTRIRAYRVQGDPPSAQHDEITEKGYLNQRAVLSRRADEVALLFVASPKLDTHQNQVEGRVHG